jgi:hypothetical protein
MSDGHPRCRLHSLTLESDGLDRALCDLRPLVITELPIVGREGQGEVPNMAAGRIGSIRVASRVESGTEVRDLLQRQRSSLFYAHHYPRSDDFASATRETMPSRTPVAATTTAGVPAARAATSTEPDDRAGVPEPGRQDEPTPVVDPQARSPVSSVRDQHSLPGD